MILAAERMNFRCIETRFYKNKTTTKTVLIWSSFWKGADAMGWNTVALLLPLYLSLSDCLLKWSRRPSPLGVMGRGGIVCLQSFTLWCQALAATQSSRLYIPNWGVPPQILFYVELKPSASPLIDHHQGSRGMWSFQPLRSDLWHRQARSAIKI